MYKLFGSNATLLLGIIWVQTVCKGYLQTTQVGERLNPTTRFLTWNLSFNKGITVFKIFIWGGISLDIRLEI